MFKNITHMPNSGNSNEYYLKITEQDKRKYGASRAYFLELIKRLSKKNGFCSAYDNYFMTHCHISKKTVYNYFKYFEDLGILKREKDDHGRRIITLQGVKVTPRVVSFTDEKTLKAIPIKGSFGVYNNIYNKNKTVYDMDLSKEEIEKEFKKQIKDLEIRIDDMVLLNEIIKFEEYIKQRKRSKYSLSEQIAFWIQNDKGCFKGALEFKIKREKELLNRKKEEFKRKAEEKQALKNQQMSEKFSTILFTLEDKYKKKHKIREISLVERLKIADFLNRFVEV
jgi:Fe2+ or Zn2+ uptake regulation protein